MQISFTLCSILPKSLKVCSSSKSDCNESPDGFLAVDESNRQVLWFSKSGAKVIKAFTVTHSNCIPRYGLSSEVTASFCQMKKLMYVAILTTPLSLTFHRTAGAEFYDLTLLQPTKKITSCEFGLLLHSSHTEYTGDEKVETERYHLVTSPSDMPVAIDFYDPTSDVEEIKYDHEILSIDGSIILSLSKNKVHGKELVLWQLESWRTPTSRVKLDITNISASQISHTHINHLNGNKNALKSSISSNISGGKRRIEVRSPETVNSSYSGRNSPYLTHAGSNSSPALEHLLGFDLTRDRDRMADSSSRDSSSPVAWMSAFQSNSSGRKFGSSQRPVRVGPASSPHHFAGPSNTSTSRRDISIDDIANTKGSIHSEPGLAKNQGFRFKKVGHLLVDDINGTTSVISVTSVITSSGRLYSILLSTSKKIKVLSATGALFELSLMSAESPADDVIGICTVRTGVTDYVNGHLSHPELSPTIDLSLSLHASRPGGFESTISCNILGHSCGLSTLYIETDLMDEYYSTHAEMSLPGQIISVRDIGTSLTPFVLVAFDDGRQCILMTSPFLKLQLVTSPATNDSNIAVTAICGELLALLLNSSPNSHIGAIAEFVHVADRICSVQTPDLPLTLLISAASCKDFDDTTRRFFSNGMDMFKSLKLLYAELCNLFLKSNDGIKARTVIMTYLEHRVCSPGCKSSFALRCHTLIKGILKSLSIDVSVNAKLNTQQLSLQVADRLLSVFMQKYRKYQEEEQPSSPYIGVLEALLTCVKWLRSSNIRVKAQSVTTNSEESLYMIAIHLLPPALRIAVSVACQLSLLEAKDKWPDWMLFLLDRTDIIARRRYLRGEADEYWRTGMEPIGPATLSSSTSRPSSSASSSSSSSSIIDRDGLLQVEYLSGWRFPEDDRLAEVSRLLRSSVPHYLRVERAPEDDDKEHLHKQQLKLLSLCRRALATTIGRGMYTIDSFPSSSSSSSSAAFHAKVPVAFTALSGRIPPTNSVISLDTSNAPAELTLWPDFHAGVAAGLRVSPIRTEAFRASDESNGDQRSNKSVVNQPSVTRNWILYNRPITPVVQRQNEAETARALRQAEQENAGYAGTLLGLGLLGHLTALTITDVCDFLTSSYEPMTVGLLIGLSASKIGSADPVLSKTLCLHLPALLPASHWDMEFSPLVQCAALTGLGLLHRTSAHRLMTEFLVAEILRSPSCVEKIDSREAVSLSAGWALGMVLLGRGRESYGKLGGFSDAGRFDAAVAGIADLGIEDRLQQLIEGGKRPHEFSLFANLPVPSIDINSKSSRLLECDDINTNVTAPGACIALGLMYVRTNNKLIADRLAIPTTAFALDHIRPDMIIFRAVAHCLVDWTGTQPSEDWLMRKVPKVVLKTLNISQPPCVLQPQHPGQKTTGLGKRAALQVYLCSITGLCWGIGLVFAGSLDSRAKDLLITQLRILQRIREGKPQNPLLLADKPTKPLVDMCLSIMSSSLGMVMAGSGDVESLRVLRELRWRAEDGTYGSHLAVSMSLGFLFLAGGRASLRRDPSSVAALLLSTAPRFPARTLDHQYHMQAQRHLYVLAMEWRLLRVIDVDSGKMISTTVEVAMRNGSISLLNTPCLLGELSDICEIRLPGTCVDYVALPLTMSDELLRNHTLPPYFVKQTARVETSSMLTSLSSSSSKLHVAMAAASYCLAPFDTSPAPACIDTYLDGSRGVLNLAANNAIAMGRSVSEDEDHEYLSMIGY